MKRITPAEYRALLAAEPASRPRRHKGALREGRPKLSPHEHMQRILAPVHPGKLLLKPEETLAAAFGATLRACALDGRLRAVFCHVPNEIAGRRQSRTAQIRYTIAKAMGLIEGAPDYLFMWADGSGALEAKTATGRQTDGQKGFEHWCRQNDVPYRIFRTSEEGLAILEEWGVWNEPSPRKESCNAFDDLHPR